MSRPNDIKPRLWNCDPGTVAYNCARMGLPMPVLAIPMWEGSGNKVYDYSGQQNHGIITSATWRNNGLHFDGTGDYITVGHHSSLDNQTIYSYFAQIKVENIGGNSYGGIICKDGIWEHSTMYSAAGELYGYIPYSDTGAASKTNLGVIQEEVLQTVLSTYNESKDRHIRLYVNGPEVSNYSLYTASVGTINDDASKDLIIGEKAADRYFCGSIYVVIVWNIDLSPRQAQTLSNNPYGMFEPIKLPIWSYVASDGTTYYETPSGAMPAPAGALTHSVKFVKSVTGAMPAMSGVVSSTTTFVEVTEGAMPASSGGIAKKVSKNMSGSMPASSGSPAKKTAKSFAGDMPEPSGTLSRKTGKPVSGIMAAMAGAVSTALNPLVVAVGKFYKLIGSGFKKFIG